MGGKYSSSPALTTSTEAHSATFLSAKPHSRSLNFPKLVASSRSVLGGVKKLKNKRNVSATFNINEYESNNDSQDSNPQSCISSLSSNQNVSSSTSSMSNAPGFVVGRGSSSCNTSNCNILGSDCNKDNLLLNINTATEEAFMTLPGVTRQTARNIVSYRKLIGGFKNIQDVALVSGVGATLFVRFRSDITCFGVPPEVILEQQQQQQLQQVESTKMASSQHQKSKFSTLSKHSSTSSSGIDISTINEDEDPDVEDKDNNDHIHHRHRVNNDKVNSETSVVMKTNTEHKSH